MKTLKIVLIFLATATSDPVVRTWTFPELAFATGNNSERKTEEELEYLEDAKYEMAVAYGEDNSNNTAQIVIPSPSGRSKWTQEELQAQNPKPLEYFDNFDNIKTSEEARDFAKEHAITIAYRMLLSRRQEGQKQYDIEVSEPGLDISKWNIDDLKNGLRDPRTHPALKPRLEDAFHVLMEYVNKGFRNESIVILTPMGLIRHKQKFDYKRKTTRRRLRATTTTTKFKTLHPKGWPIRRP
ncbi:unnamed protein product [Arctia plantaginis]|uniref:Uncharacterized protein n=1 Tax=Arctia plantaginis TaxID=874455 RepID=A0A8S0ZN09_ARCPL|nr:unnamed protein product [Arctia plantaginis]